MGFDRMSEKCYIAKSTALAARVLGDELIIMSATNSTLFALNGTAMAIWEAADGVTPLENIVAAQICEDYDVAPEVALEDAEEVVAELAEHGLLLISDEPIVPAASSVTKEST
jgi:hypothetical protein